MTPNEPLPLTDEQVAVLARYLRLDVGLDEVRRVLSGVFEFSLEPETRSASMRFRVPEPGILVARTHISNALEQKRLGLISEKDLTYWATFILLNEAYELDPPDEDFIADWLNDMSYNLDPT
jgi:hypothetical protein